MDRGNPIKTKLDWKVQRAAAQRDPGHFHGEIAKREIFWFEPILNAWVKKLDPSGWQRLDAKTGKVESDTNLPEDHQPWKKAFQANDAPFYKWFEGGLTNAGFNEVDAPVAEGRGDEIAFIFESETWNPTKFGGKGGPEQVRKISRKELLWEVARYGLALKQVGLKSGDRITINMPNVLEQIFVIEASKRLGIIYNCVAAGLSAKTIADRIQDSASKLLVTSEWALMGSQRVGFKREFAAKAVSDFIPADSANKIVENFIQSTDLDLQLKEAFSKEIGSLCASEITVSRADVLSIFKHCFETWPSKNTRRIDAVKRQFERSLASLRLSTDSMLVIPYGASKEIRNQENRKEYNVLPLLAAADKVLLSKAKMSPSAPPEEFLKIPNELFLGAINASIPAIPVDANFPLFIMYTSGSTGRPKGVVHVHGYLAGLAYTMKVCFNVTPGDGQVIYVVADPGWITGQSYMICGALAARVTSVISEAAPIFPFATRFASIIERNQVTIFKAGSTFLKTVLADPNSITDLHKYDISKLKVGTFCAEPTSPAIQAFAMEVLTPRYINSYWATEHGGIILTHFYDNAEFELKPNTHSFPLPWIFADVWVAEQSHITGETIRFEYRSAQIGEMGEIVITDPYPYMARTIWGDVKNFGSPSWKGDIDRFRKTYFDYWTDPKSNGQKIRLAYTQRDLACKTSDDGFTLHGRSDDVINTSGHRIGTEEIEGAILRDKRLTPDSPVGNVIVAGAPHPLAGTVPVAFIQRAGARDFTFDDERRLNDLVKKEKGEHAIPAAYLVIPQFPETRNGKYIRRYLARLLHREPVGDTTTLRNPESLTQARKIIDEWLVASKAEASSSRTSGELSLKWANASEETKREVVREYLIGLIADVIGPDFKVKANAGQIDWTVSFRDMSLTSLKSLQLTTRLKLVLGNVRGTSISSTVTFNYPTLDSLTDYICNQILTQSVRKSLVNKRRNQDDNIAIVGMSCRFPGQINSPEDLWKALTNERNVITEIPLDRWDNKKVYDSDKGTSGKTYTQHGGFISNIDLFDPRFFNISPGEATAMDPQQRLLLESSWEALENSGISPHSLAGSRTGVFVGITAKEYLELVTSAEDRELLEAYVPSGTNLNTAAGHISYFLNTHGPSLIVDTACSSSLVAIHLACQSLKSGESDVALAGGVNLMLTPSFTIFMSRAQALSEKGRCATFDASADGYARSEGCGIIVLKRLKDALAEGDNILAVVRGSAVNHDGKTSSFTAPNGLSQEELLREALGKAGIKPYEVGYVEAHGSATPIGDPIEVQALSNVLREGRDKEHPLFLSSVKTNIGHTESAAGVAGVIKTVLALQHRILPKHLHLNNLNPSISLAEVPAQIPTKETEWKQINGRRIAGISSFGFSGTNAHILVEEGPAKDPNVKVKDDGVEHLLTISARTPDALRELSERYVRYLMDTKNDIADICFSAHSGRAHFEERLAIVGHSKEQIRLRIEAYLKSENTSSLTHGKSSDSEKKKIAMLFSGQGSQYPGMAKGLYESQPTFRQTLDRCASLLKDVLDLPLLDILWGDKKNLIEQTRYTQPALFSIEYSLAEMWRSWGIIPTAVVGHSVGEYVAACVAEVFSLEDGLKLIAKRGELIQGLPGKGAMVVINTNAEKAAEIIKPFNGRISVAAVNGAENTTLAGFEGDIDNLLALMEKAGIRTTKLTVSHGFHSMQMDPILEEFEQFASSIKYSKPKIKFISNRDGQSLEGQIPDAKYWRNHIRDTVRFADGIQTLWKNNYRLFLEIGPGTTLVGMGRQHVNDIAGESEQKANWIPTLKKDSDDWNQVLENLGILFANGAAIDWKVFDKGNSERRKVRLPNYPFQRKRYWVKVKDQELMPTNAKTIHPMLGRPVQYALRPGEYIFESTVGPSTPNFLADHTVYNTVVVPGAAFMEMAIAAAKKVFKNDSNYGNIIIEEFMIKQALALGQNDNRMVQCIFTGDKDQPNFQILSRRISDEHDWVVHATGRIASGSAPGGSDLKSLQDQFPEERNVADHYRAFKDLGIDYGPRFLVVDRLWKKSGEVLAFIRLTDAMKHDQDSYFIHPVLLDGCLQVAQALFAEVDPKGQILFLPFSVEKIAFHKKPEGPVWCHMKRRPVEGSHQKMLLLDFTLYDNSGSVVFEAVGYTIVEAPREAMLRLLVQGKSSSSLRNSMFEPEWVRVAAPNRVHLPEKETWLILSDNGGVGAALAKDLENKGHHAILINENPLSKGTFDSVFKAFIEQSKLKGYPQLRRIIHLLSLDNPIKKIDDAAAETLEHEHIATYGSLILLTQSIANAGLYEGPQLCIATLGLPNSAVPTTAGTVLSAPLWSFERIASVENPEFRTRLIELDNMSDISAKAHTLFAEISSGESDGWTAYRGQQRFICRLTRSKTEDLTSHSEDWKVEKDGTYMITGGLGALGVRTALCLVKHGARNIILCGRNSPSSDAQEYIALMRKEGVEPKILKVDVSDYAALKLKLNNILKDGATLKGVIHAAGIENPHFVFEETLQHFSEGMSAKVKGAWNLHRLTKSLPLDFFVMFSSASTLMPAPRQGTYSASNAFLDALTHMRKSMGLTALSINWGPWAEVGMAQKNHSGLSENRNWEKGGLKNIPVDEGLNTFASLVLGQHLNGQIAIVPIDWDKFTSTLPAGATHTIFEKMVPSQKPRMVIQEGREVSTSFPVGAEAITKFLKKELAILLGRENSDDLDTTQKLTSMGLDSLMAIEFRGRLKNALGATHGKSLPTTLFFQYPTLNALVEFLTTKVLAPQAGGPPTFKLVKPNNPWIFVPEHRPQAKLRIFCFPYGGGSTSIFSSWAQWIPADYEIRAVEFPGRWTRVDETPYKDLQMLTDAVEEGLKNEIDSPYIVLGYSFGALVAFEWLKRLQASHKPMPQRFIVSASFPPHQWDAGWKNYLLPDRELIAKLGELYGYDGLMELMEQKEKRDLLLPSLRADTEMADKYNFRPSPKFDFPISVLSGAQDKTVTPTFMAEWARFTKGSFDQTILKGKHFIIHENYLEFQRAIVAVLQSHLVLIPPRLKSGTG